MWARAFPRARPARLEDYTSSNSGRREPRLRSFPRVELPNLQILRLDNRSTPEFETRLRGMKAMTGKNDPQIRSAPNSREFWDARTALPQVCSGRKIEPTP